MGRVISTCLQFIDAFTNPATKTIKQMQRMGREMTYTGKKIQKAGNNIANTGKFLTKTVTTPILTVGVTSMKTAADFEQAMAQVAATMGKPIERIRKLSQLARKMGKTTSFSATEAAEGINILAQAGLNANQIAKALRPTLDLAAAGNLSLEQSAQYVTASVAGFSDSMKNASKYADMIAKGATMAKTDVSALGTALGGVSSTASKYNQTAKSTTVALLRLAQANITGMEASTGLSAVMTRVYAPTSQATKAMKELGVSAYNVKGQARDFNDVIADLSIAMSHMSQKQENAYKKMIFGTSRLGIFNAMATTSAEKVKKFSNQLGSCGNAAYKMAQTQLKTLNGKITLLKSAMEGAAITVGNKVMPIATKAVGYAQKTVDWFNNLSDAQQTNIIKWCGIAATVGPTLLIFGKMVAMVGGLVVKFGMFTRAVASAGGIFGLLTSPTAIVIGGLVAIAVGTALVIKNWDKIRPVCVTVKKALSETFGPGITQTLKFVKEIASNVSDVFQTEMPKAIAFCKKEGKSIGVDLVPALKSIKKLGVLLAPVFSGAMKYIAIEAKKTMPIAKTFGRALTMLIKLVITSWVLLIKWNLQAFTVTVNCLTWILIKARPFFATIGMLITVAANLVRAKLVFIHSTTANVLGNILTCAQTTINAGKQIFNGIIQFVTGVFTGNWKKAWTGVKNIFGGIFDGLGGMMKLPINTVISLINGAIDGINSISVDIPKGVPGVQEKHIGFHIKHIPALAKGTNDWKGGLAQVHEKGGEIIDLPKGTRVYPNDISKKMVEKKSNVTITISKLADKIEVRNDADIDQFANEFANKLKDVALNM